MANVDERVEELNDIIQDLRSPAEYNNHSLRMNVLFRQISGHFEENNGERLLPAVKAIYLHLPNNITLANQAQIIHELWILLQPGNNLNMFRSEEYPSDYEYEEPDDFFPPMLAAAPSQVAQGKRKKGKKSKKCKGKKCKKGRKSRRKSRRSRR